MKTPPDCTSAFLRDRGTLLSASTLIFFLCFFNFVCCEGLRGTRPCTTFQQHSQTALIKSWSHTFFKTRFSLCPLSVAKCERAAYLFFTHLDIFVTELWT